VFSAARFEHRVAMVDVHQERHLEDAVAAIEPRVTGRAFPDTATRAAESPTPALRGRFVTPVSADVSASS